MNERIANLKELALSLEDGENPLERARLVTASYRETEGARAVVRRARALEKVLTECKIRIHERELIVGLQRRLVYAIEGIREDLRWLRGLTFPELTRGRVPDESCVPAEAQQWLSYWRSQPNPHARIAELRTAEGFDAQRDGIFSAGGLLTGHAAPRFEKVLTLGLDAIAADADQRASALDAPERKRDFWRAVSIACRAAIAHAKRYAQLAQHLAGKERDARRREELSHIAAICRRVPARPATTFRQGVQAVWFIHRIQELEQGGPGAISNSLGRIDQYLYPLYRADIDAGRITEDEALELVECLWLKLHRTLDHQLTTIAGMTPSGEDATNELSHLCVRALAELRLPRALSARIHGGTPKPFLAEVAHALKLGLGRPDLWNDEVVIDGLVASGIPLEEARDYSVVGCIEVSIAGRDDTRIAAHTINPAKCLELALHRDDAFQDSESLRRAYRQQIERAVRFAVDANLAAERVQPDFLPHPFLSALTDDCVERGLDVTEGGARYNSTTGNFACVATIANSLAAIKRLVFEEKRVAFDELRAALSSDFDGREPLRQLLLNRSPKFGNDDPYVDSIAAEEMLFYCGELARYRNGRGGGFQPCLFLNTGSAAQLGRLTGASADGRRAGRPISMGATPSVGADRESPVAAVKSVARLNHHPLAGGMSFILDLHPSNFAGTEGTDKIIALIRTYFDLGGMEIGVNVIDERLLRAAQRDPEKHRHLTVRLYGFSTHFTSLDPATQDYVIRKTKHL